MSTHNLCESYILKHVDILQSIINRMALNSLNCKTWCIALVSAMLVFIESKVGNSYIGVIYFPVVMFFVLDVYYLSL
jgi:hypothetical protein